MLIFNTKAKSYNTMLAMLMSLSCHLNQITTPMTRLIPAIMTQSTPGSLLSHSEQVRTCQYTGSVMTDLESYTQDNHELLLFRKVVVSLLRSSNYSQPIAFLSKQFPVKSVNAAIKKQMKHVWHKLRNTLLTGIVAGARTPEDPQHSRTWVGPHLRIRFCYFCLATTANHFDAESHHVSQWDQIDMQLNANHSEFVRYTNC
ncbi:hypothetical protein VP01_333g13 [Puccinia sorghi]|uniref:Uncharacterized protein n=1 Tax=Puccinia sorghi TaxID=27349 RepID=A0A0L6UXZ3_9BASI|nr:hypothetical protein VP01_333g13 [Puccinia sorghi]